MIDGLWDKANKVSEIGYKIDSVAGIAELVAERLTDNAESGALWTVAEILREYGEKLEVLSAEIMSIQRAHNDKLREAEENKFMKKGKKK